MKKLLLIIGLILCALVSFSQPIIALGSTKSFIKRNMQNDADFKLTEETKCNLQYKYAQKGQSVLYRFKLSRPFICEDMVVDFQDEQQMLEYLDDKLNSCKLKPVNDDVFELNTDLFTEPIYFVIVGLERILITQNEKAK